MYERLPQQEPLTGFEKLVEPIKIVEIGCGISSDGSLRNAKLGRIFHLPHKYVGIEREQAFVYGTRHRNEVDIAAALKFAEESGAIFGNAADMPFDDDSIDVITMRSVFGQFTGNDHKEFNNVFRNGIMEAFRVLKPGGIIAISEENTPWGEDKVFHFLNHFGFAIIDYAAMHKDWYAPDKRSRYGRDGNYRNLYAPENEEWLKKLGQFYGNDSHSKFLSSPRQYILVAQKQQPASVETTRTWSKWTVTEDTFAGAGSTSTKQKKVYKHGEPVEQKYLSGMYRANYSYHNQDGLFYMPPKQWF